MKSTIEIDLKKLMVVLIFLTGILIGITLGEININKYDVNKEGKVNAQDYVLIKNYIMEE